MIWRTLVLVKFTMLFIFWPFSVLAAVPLSLDQELHLISATTWVVVIIAINIGGMASLLQKISDSYDQARKEKSLPTPLREQWRMIAAHIAVSWFVGLVAFFSALKYEMSGLAIPIFVPVVSFGGIRMAELMYSIITEMMRLKFGTKAPNAE